ncbi:MAG: CBS domain-containing protein [Mariprofundus sp.]
MLAGNVMSSDVTSINLESTVRDAAALFQQSALHDVPVVDVDGKPVGMVTCISILQLAVPGYASGDLLATMKAGPAIDSVYHNLEAIIDQPVTDAMTRNYEVVKASVPTSAVAAMLTTLKCEAHDILVVDDDGKLIGIISARDIICRLPTSSTA